MNKKIFILFFTFFSFISSILFCQDVRMPSLMPNYFKIAEELYKNQKYYEAISWYEKALEDKKEKKNVEANLHLAECYRKSRIYLKAEELYNDLAKTKADKYPETMFWLAMMEMANEKYDKAISSFSSYLTLTKGTELASIAKEKIKACEEAKEAIKNPVVKEISPLGPEINKAYANYGGATRRDSFWFVGSSEMTKYPEKVNLDKAKGRYDLFYLNRLYVAKKIDKKSWEERQPMELKIKDKVYHISSPAFNIYLNQLFYTICKPQDNKEVCYIYRSDVTATGLSDPIKINPPVNLPNSNSKQPMLVQYGSRQLLFFTSDRNDGFGGYDIYYCFIDNGLDCDSPNNLGKTINTKDDEYSPFYDFKLKNLYFSSNGKAGLGGFDVYKVDGDPQKGWGKVVNYGYPVNSGADDYYYSHFPTGSGNYTAYISSNRLNDNVFNETSCCDNLYTFDFSTEKKVSYAIKGKVSNKETNEALKDFSVKIYNCNNKKIKTLVVKNSNEFVVDLKRDSCNYIIISKKDFDSTQISLNPSEDDTLYYSNILLSKAIIKPIEKPIETPKKDPVKKIPPPPIETASKKFDCPINIYWGFNEYIIIPSEQAKLDKFVQQIKSNPNAKMLIASYTDNVDTKGFNITLSKLRTEKIINFLTSKGVATDRMVGQWWGEEKPLSNNQRGDGSDNPEGRKLNRRTEIVCMEDLAGVPSGQMVSDEKEDLMADSYTGQRGSSDLDPETMEKIMAKYGDASKEGLLFKIQIGAYLKPAESAHYREILFNTIKSKCNVTISNEIDLGFTKYLAGKASTLNEAQKIKFAIRNNGVKTAFIVPYYKGKRIKIVDAIELLGE